MASDGGMNSNGGGTRLVIDEADLEPTEALGDTTFNGRGNGSNGGGNGSNGGSLGSGASPAEIPVALKKQAAPPPPIFTPSPKQQRAAAPSAPPTVPPTPAQTAALGGGPPPDPGDSGGWLSNNFGKVAGISALIAA